MSVWQSDVWLVLRSTKEEEHHAWYWRPNRIPRATEIIAPRKESPTAILLDKCNFLLHSNLLLMSIDECIHTPNQSIFSFYLHSKWRQPQKPHTHKTADTNKFCEASSRQIHLHHSALLMALETSRKSGQRDSENQNARESAVKHLVPRKVSTSKFKDDNINRHISVEGTRDLHSPIPRQRVTGN